MPPSTQTGFPSKGCHNCRRRRLRCDKSYPACHKCSNSGEECLGYGAVLRWANAPAIRGKLAGYAPFTAPAPGTLSGPVQPTKEKIELPEEHEGTRGWEQTPLTPSAFLTDPLLNHLNRASRHYVHHFNTSVCRDLVSIDQNSRNPFRIMIPLISRFPYLEALVIATSAMHLATMHRYQGRSAHTELVDALAAKDKAIRSLRAAISHSTPASQAMVLVAIVFFINLDLIDSGKGGWKAHITAAGSLIASLQHNDLDASLVPLADAIAADCLTYRILGSTVNGGEAMPDADISVLTRMQAHSYHCCPPAILQIILSASQLGPEDSEQAMALLCRARALDVRDWVNSIRGLSAQDDLQVRVGIASAHRATACLYACLVVPAVGGHVPAEMQPDGLVLEILEHLATVPVDHALLKGTVWPTFMAGAQTDDVVWRGWCLDRLRAVWTKNPWICPWGYIRTATEMLEKIWDGRAALDGRNWLQQLKGSKDNCLIV
ncbi:fungal-specific transcription factor domain-containing protein [Lasiosphaeria hispida]|uniref:Fungal-specific transcription factor domain-containing protein n=1 Tax=Lasiosphaeria hispida TaxID=260671 RepID=A0AAJ0H5J8_9PEZI|nr:fungal-specific transcription factor domain-containing protein [Lasiosphaeria hispida]